MNEFAETLDAFLESLPNSWPYGVEIRNKHWLAPEYFAMLSKHGVAHVFNSWTDKAVADQLASLGSVTNPHLVGHAISINTGAQVRRVIKNVSAMQPHQSGPFWRGVSFPPEPLIQCRLLESLPFSDTALGILFSWFDL